MNATTDVNEIKAQIDKLIKIGKNHNYGNHLIYTTKRGERFLKKLQENGVNCHIRKPSEHVGFHNKYKHIDIIFDDVP